MDATLMLKRKHANENEDDLITLSERENASAAKLATYVSYTDRYFRRYYKLNVRQAGNDHLMLMHSNRVVVCSLAPTHPIVADPAKYRVDRCEFLQLVNEEMSGKHKHNAKNVNVDQPLCKLHCTITRRDSADELDTVYFLICSCLNAKLIETNDQLIGNPQLVQSKPSTQGYVFILMPKLDNLKEQMAHAEIMTHEAYTATNNAECVT